MKSNRVSLLLFILLPVALSCRPADGGVGELISSPFQNKYLKGKAEVSSYRLNQARYGELHGGRAVLVFVTEDFSLSKQVKLDHPDRISDDRVTILKLNYVKKFLTGLYPYSMLLSVYTPLDLANHPHTLKSVATTQEWCGNVFTQMNFRNDGYRYQLNSYFESEGDEVRQLPGVLLEDEIWNRIRLTPSDLPIGSVRIIPGMLSSRLRHISLEAEQARITLGPAKKDGVLDYQIDYPDSRRKLIISFERHFPHKIVAWEESHISGWGKKAKRLTTTARLEKSILIDYWNHHEDKDRILRRALDLPF